VSANFCSPSVNECEKAECFMYWKKSVQSVSCIGKNLCRSGMELCC